MSTSSCSAWTDRRACAPTARIGRAGWLRSSVPVVALLVLAAALAARSWGTWPDPLIDFGRELYVPWRMAEGEVLYRDIAYFNGPLSPTINAALFRSFGASLQTLVTANCLLLLLVALALRGALRKVAGIAAANVGIGAFLLLFAFAQFLTVRNYNYLCPYSHEMTHGLLLSLWALLAIWRATTANILAPLASGVLLGLVALTKVELTVAATAGVVASAVLLSRTEATPWRKIAQWSSLVALGAAIPLLVAIVSLSHWMSPAEAFSRSLGAWAMAGNNEIRDLDFYRHGMGTFDLGVSLRAIAVSLSRWSLFLAAGVLACSLGRSARNRWLIGAFGLAAAITLWLSGFQWPTMERALPVLMMVLIGWRFTIYLSPSRPSIDGGASSVAPAEPTLSDRRRIEACRIGWCVFALAILAKMLLNSRIGHYGFVLAVPATMTIVVLLYDWLPTALTARKKWGGALPWLATPMLVAYAAAYQMEQNRLTACEQSLGEGADQFAVGESAAPVNSALDHIRQRVAPGETLAVLPEGVMLNYLARRRVSVPYITWMPPEVLHFGESEMLSRLVGAPPDWVILAHRDLAEYGVPQFGEGFADGIARWIEGNYRVEEQWDEGRWRLLQRAADQTAHESVFAQGPAD